MQSKIKENWKFLPKRRLLWCHDEMFEHWGRFRATYSRGMTSRAMWPTEDFQLFQHQSFRTRLLAEQAEWYLNAQMVGCHWLKKKGSFGSEECCSCQAPMKVPYVWRIRMQVNWHDSPLCLFKKSAYPVKVYVCLFERPSEVSKKWHFPF